MDKSDILIVGAGPTGLTAALTLARRGIKPRIIDKRAEPITTANALVIQPRTLEVWEDLKIVNDALQQGHRLVGAEIFTKNKVIFDLSYQDLPTRYPYMLAWPQARTEHLLATHLASAGVKVERGIELENLLETENGISAVCNGVTSNYRWVVGCDGANSTARQSAKITFKGKESFQHFIMAEICVDWSRTSDKIIITLSDDGPFAFFPQDNKGTGRLVFDVSRDQRLKYEKNPTFDDFKKLMNRRAGVKATLQEPNWISTFWIHNNIAKDYRKGHLFLAGDAAHQHSPFGGQGMNTGIQDAYFLGNLLADVIEGKQSEKELARYEKVRKSVGKHVIRQSAMMTTIITMRSKPLKWLINVLLSEFSSFPTLTHTAAMRISQLTFR
ncbi:MAG TPA: FAD-dependent monooxygenase [Myxococcota bacterium]|nr:FAD-dependent monooxygenase [Myxococcota bacterium]